MRTARLVAVAAVAALLTAGCSSPSTPASVSAPSTPPATANAGAAGPAPSPSPSVGASAAPVVRAAGLDSPAEKEIAMELVSSAENSTLNWKAQYRYIEDIKDGRGYTAGIIGFCSGTGDMLAMVTAYTKAEPGNVLARFLPALTKVNGTASHAGLGQRFVAAWHQAAKDPVFQRAQDAERDQTYFDPAVAAAKQDGLGTLGQFIYYDATVMHGPGDDPESFGGIRAAAHAKARPPSKGGNQVAYLNAFLDVRVKVMKREEVHTDTSRVDDAQRVFLRAGNLNLTPPLHWKVYGDPYAITT